MAISLGVKKLKSVKSEFILGIQQVLAETGCVSVCGEERSGRLGASELSSLQSVLYFFCFLSSHPPSRFFPLWLSW